MGDELRNEKPQRNGRAMHIEDAVQEAQERTSQSTQRPHPHQEPMSVAGLQHQLHDPLQRFVWEFLDRLAEPAEAWSMANR